MRTVNQRRIGSFSLLLILLTTFLPTLSNSLPIAVAATTPSSVTIAGTVQSKLGCGGDWAANCANTHLSYDSNDDVWQGSFNLPSSTNEPDGVYQYKAALNDGWDENYGANATLKGANINLKLASTSTVKFYYDHKTHWVTDNKNSVIATVPGDFQTKLGCASNWDPGCLRSWLQDPNGSGTYTFETTALPAGTYNAKVAINESWDENYGPNGTPNSNDNIKFTVSSNNARVKFSYNPTSHILLIQAGHGQDNNVEYLGLGHNSQDPIYRQPFGAVNPGTEIKLRFRTFHNDVTGVRVRFYDTATSKQFFQDMTLAAADVSCFAAELAAESCDFWETKYTPTQLSTLYYRFIVTDGTASAYYADDNYKDGGWGTPTPNVVDNSYNVTIFDPQFKPIPWLKDAVIYQIFPDRFRNGRKNNDPNGQEPRYSYPSNPDDQIIAKKWSDLPEGYCRGYLPTVAPCYDSTGKATEIPRGRDYFGGDLKGVDQQLDYLKSQGVNVIYFNPIFDAGSDHAYDTQNYFSIDPFFGTQKDWENLVKHANDLGIRIILDGVFNHVSSDSKYFDRYHHFSEVGACESLSSPYRTWFYFQDVPLGQGPCVGSDAQHSATYTAWFGFDSIPVLNKNLQAVRDLVYAQPDSVSRYWLNQGAAGWRLDVMGDGSFPDEYWQQFRKAVKATKPDAPIIGELWKKDEMLPKIHGDIADTGMNYRFRNAILGMFGKVDNKGFADDGQSDLPPSIFARKLNSLREDYPDATYYTLMNLMDSHDTQRILWSLTPGGENRQDKEFNAANLALGKQRLKLATIVQFTIPGAPTVYYGDEVGVTGADDPDDRRTFPWIEQGDNATPGGDAVLRQHYQQLATIRKNNPVLRDGALKFLLTDDSNRTMAYAMRSDSQIAIVAINRNETDTSKTLTIPLTGYLRDGVTFTNVLGGGSVTSSGGKLVVNLPKLGGAIFVANSGQDLTPPSAASNLKVTNEANGQISLSWNSVPGAATYNVYRSVLSGGGWEKVNTTPLTVTTFTDSNLQNARNYYYVVKALDSVGNEGTASNETSGMAHLVINWANLQWPPSINHTISTTNRTSNVYGRVWIADVTKQPGQTPTLRAQLGFGPQGSNPANNSQWVWVEAGFNTNVGENDEFAATMLPTAIGNYDYVYRYTTTDGRDWVYADQNGLFSGSAPSQPGNLTVVSSGDTSAPTVPGNLNVNAASPAGVNLSWNASNDNAGVYGYEVLRSSSAGGPYSTLALVTTTNYSDTSVVENSTYYYVVRAVDYSWNRSNYSNQVSATAKLRTVTLVINLTVPTTTDGTGRTVTIAGFLDRLDGGLPQWDPTAVKLTRVDATHWTISFTGKEGTQLEYKYALSDWNYVEKDNSCGEVANRTLTLSYGSNGTQTVNDVIANWRNVAPCGN